MSESIRGIYLDVLGREPDAAGWNSFTDALNSGALSYWDIRSQIAHSGEAAGDIDTLYWQVLGRAGDPVGLAGYEDALGNGQSLAGARWDMAHDAEASVAIQNIYQGLFGHGAVDSEVGAIESWLGNGLTTITQLRWNDAHTDAAAAAIQGVYQTVLGRPAVDWEISTVEGWLGNGMTIAQLRWNDAHSAEATNALDGIYRQVLGRGVDQIGITNYEDSALGVGWSLGDVRWHVAHSSEAAEQVNSLYWQVLGRPADPVGQAGYEEALADGQSLAGARSDMAHDVEAGVAIQNVYQSVFGHGAAASEVSTIEGWLGNDLTTISQFRWDSAHTDAAAAAIQGVYQSVLGRAAVDWEISTIESFLGNGTTIPTIADLRSNHAYSSEALGNIQAAYRSQRGRDATATEVGYWQSHLADGSITHQQLANVSSVHINASSGSSGSDYPADVIEAARVDFDAAYYLAHNPDVAASGADPYLHYCLWGWKEGRNPNAFFDTNYYLQNNPDVAAAGVNPLAHYHQFGWKEGLDPSASFSTSAYLAAYPDVAAADIDPLEHYTLFGAADGRTVFQVGASATTSVHNLTLFVAEDAWQGDAQFTVRVDGFQIGGIRTANASYAAGGRQAVSLDLNLAPGAHVIQVAFVNDAWGQTPEDDRNFYLLNATLDGQDIPTSSATFKTNGTFNFSVTTGDSAIPAIQAIYQSILGRAATTDELISNQTWFSSGATLANLRVALANSAEATSQIRVVYSDVLWRPADPDGLSTYRTLLAAGWSLADVRRTLAHSAEAGQNLQSLFSTHLGRAATSDEILGFEMALSRDDKGNERFLVSSTVGTIASADARTLLAELGSYVTLSGGFTPTLTASDGEVLNFRDATYLAGFALGLCVQAGQAGPAAWDIYGPTVSWLADIGQGYLQEAWKLQEAAKEYAASGYLTDAYLQSLGAQMARQIQAMPPGQRHNLVLQVPLGTTAAEITVTGDPSGGGGLATFSFRLYDPDPGRTALIADAQAYEASAEAAEAAGNQLLAFLDQCQARVDAAYAQLPATARTDKMLGVAQQFVSAAFDAAGRGNWNLVQTLEVAADVSLRLAALPPDQRTAPMTERFIHEQVKHDITVDPTSADPFATFSDHSKGPDLVGTIIEQVVGIVLNVLAFVPGVNVVAAPAAVAWDTAHAAQSFVDGDVLGGVLSLASAIGVGLVNAGAIGQALGLSAQQVENLAASALGTAASDVASLAANTVGKATGELIQLGHIVLDGGALVGGLSGIAQNAANGDGLGIAAGILQTAAAVASGLVDTGELKEVIPPGATEEIIKQITARNDAVQDFANRVAAGAGLASVGASAAAAFARGDLAGGLLVSLSTILGKITQQLAQDGGIQAWFDTSNDERGVSLDASTKSGISYTCLVVAGEPASTPPSWLKTYWDEGWSSLAAIPHDLGQLWSDFLDNPEKTAASLNSALAGVAPELVPLTGAAAEAISLVRSTIYLFGTTIPETSTFQFESATLRAAAAGKGNFGIGQAPAQVSEILGRAWVGDGYTVASDGRTLLSQDLLRQYRPPSFKPNLGITQSNFEARFNPSGQWQSNGHLTIVP